MLIVTSSVVRWGGEATKRTQTLIAVTVVIIVVMVAGLGAILVLQGNKGGGADNSDYTTFWKPEVEKFVKYTQVNDSLWNHDWTMRMTVLSINATHMMRDEAWLDSGGQVYLEANWSAPINLTFGNGYDINYDMGWPVIVTETGLEKLSTPWGDRTCIRYHALWPDGTEDDFWVHNGVMLKGMCVSPEPTANFEIGTFVLTSTNIREVTH